MDNHTDTDIDPEFTEKYIRKALIVDAAQVTEENFSLLRRWTVGTVCNNDETPVDKDAPYEPTKQYIRVAVHNPKNSRQTKAYVGDWILYTERGFKVYTTKAFQQNFDLLNEEQDLEADDDLGSFLSQESADASQA